MWGRSRISEAVDIFQPGRVIVKIVGGSGGLDSRATVNLLPGLDLVGFDLESELTPALSQTDLFRVRPHLN